MSTLLVHSNEVQARLCQNLQDPPLDRSSWNRLLQKSPSRSIFSTWQWLSTWWEAFQGDAELYTFVVMRDEELIGIAPLMLHRVEGQRIIEFLGLGSSDYCDFISSDEDKELVVQSVLEALLRRRDRWDRLRLSHVPSHSMTPQWIEQYELPAGCSQRTHVESVCPALSIEKSPAFAKSCTKKKSLVRHTRYFERIAPLEFYNVLDPDEVADLLPEFFEQHRDRRFMAGDRSLFDDRRHRRFYERMTHAMLETGWLRFSVVRWQDEVLAFHLGFLYNGVLTWYKPTFNIDYSRHSPGEVLLKKLIESALEEEAREFDFTVGNESFKERFANVMRENVCVQIILERKQNKTRRFMEETQRLVKERHPLVYAFCKHTAQRFGLAAVEAADSGVRVPPLLPEKRKLGITRRHLMRIESAARVPSEFTVTWARYSQIKEITRREGLKPEFLMQALARIRRGERTLVTLWHDRPVALLWLAREPQELLSQNGFDFTLGEGSALLTASYLAADVKASPRRETLMPTLSTFLASEGLKDLYQLQDLRHQDSVPQYCGSAFQVVATDTQLGLLFRHFSKQENMMIQSEGED